MSTDFDRVPHALRERPQWLVWRFEEATGERKPRKVPYYAGGGRRMGKQGDDADRARLVNFDRAIASMSRGEMTGIGFAFLPDDGLIGIDLDNVIDPDTGVIQPRADGIIRACGSYTEFSPSGRGVHIYSLGTTTSKKSNEIGVEMFCGRQFFTVTGRAFPGTVDDVTPIRPKVVERIHAVIEESRGKSVAAPAAPRFMRADGPADRDRIESALACVSADLGYNDWIAVGMALHDSLGESLGLEVWDWWSRKGTKYGGASSLEGHWRSFGNRSPGTDAVIFKLATTAGWRPPRPPREVRTESPPEPCAGSGAGQGGEPPDRGDDGGHGPSHDDFRTNSRGKIEPSLFNTMRVLQLDPGWRGVLGFNEFACRIVKRKRPPLSHTTIGEWSDIDDVHLQAYLTTVYKFEPRKVLVMDAVSEVAHMSPFHPVREYLDGLQWDGTPRVRALLAECWGAASTPSAASLRREDPAAHARHLTYLELAGTKWLVGAVARIFQPGCKLDTMVVFEGGQGDYKSTSIRCLFGDEWFSDSKMTIGDKDALAQMQGKWAYEMAEMDAHRKADDTAFKQFITTQIDRVRWHYGKRAEDVPRQCIFVGTTNMHQYGKDETGMRRIWPVEVGRVDIKRIVDERDQLWAEAVALYRGGATWWVDKRTTVIADEDRTWSEWDVFDEQAESRQNVDAWETPISEWLNDHNALSHFSTAEIMGDALKLDRARWTPPEQKRVAAILRRLGYKSKKVGPKYARVNGWVKVELDTGAEAPAPKPEDGGDVPI